MIGDEEDIPAGGLYALAWYCALHWGDQLTMNLLPGTVEVHVRRDASNPAPTHMRPGESIPLVWILKSGEIFFRRSNMSCGTMNPLRPHDLRYILADARRLVASRVPDIPGTLAHDPQLAAFFLACGSTTCEVTFPDETVMRVQAPGEINPYGKDNSGILLYNIERFADPEPAIRFLSAEVFMQQGRRVLEEIMGGTLPRAWASQPIGVTPYHRPPAYPSTSGIESMFK